MPHLLKDVIGKGLAASMEEKARKKEKRDSQKLKVAWVAQFMRDTAVEAGVPYSDVWVGKTYGQAKNWLEECTDNQKDPRQLIRDVVRHWSVLRMALEDRKIFIGDAASWSTFYKNRRAIEEVLEIRGKEWTKAEGSKIIYLKH